jgi:hypothetical protein
MGKLLRCGLLAMGLATCGGLSGWVGSARAEDKKDTCGKAGLPDCPLQAWMKDSMVKPKAAGDWAKLEIAFDKIGKANPFDKVKETKEFDAWASSVKKGIDASKAQNKDDVNGACNECHTATRKPYREKYRDKAVPK